MRMRQKAAHRGSLAGGRRQAGLPAQQPQEGPVQRRAVAGEVARAVEIENHHHAVSPDEDFGSKVTKVSVRGDCFGGAIETIPWEQRKPYDEFDYGYVLTVHKSQGSQWDDVVLFDESFAFQDSRARWLYTGITRAAKRLSVVV
jgi:hypothetical protein